MRAFLLRSGLMTALLLALLAGGESYVRSLPNPAKDKHACMLRRAPQVRVLILGSSHAFYDIDPSVFDGGYNLAQVSQTYRYDAFLLKNYAFDSVQAVILPFSYFSLYEDVELGTAPTSLATRYRLYMDCPLHSRLSRYGFECSDWYVFREKLRSLWAPARLSWDSLGLATNNTAASRPHPAWQNGADRAREHTYADTIAVAANLGFLEEIAAWCRERNAHLVLVATPLAPTYREAMAPQQLRRNARVLASFLSRNPEVRYADFSASSLFAEEDFYDADHLILPAAHKLATLISPLTE